MRSLLCLLLLPSALSGAESKWIQGRSGPVEFYSDAPNKVALDKLGYFEQFRFALGTLVGKPDLNCEPPIRLLIMKSPTLPVALMPGRDRIALPIAAGSADPGLGLAGSDEIAPRSERPASLPPNRERPGRLLLHS